MTNENDADLVADSLAGDRDAFGQVVARYQGLICSLAYSATGSLTQSEDLAQETFVTAWRCLPELREKAKLRSWLCGIARNLIGKTLRKASREPVHAAEPLEKADDYPSLDPVPADQAISREEEAILWRSLQGLSEIYREPLILFYREHQSVERVAEALELTPDVVKQRLSRGRKLLQEQVLAFVQGALAHSAPGKVFTLGVLAALPGMTTSAKAAAVGASAAKGSAAAKSVGLAALWNALLAPVCSIFSIYFMSRLDADGAGSAERRALIVKFYRLLVFSWIVASFVALAPLTLGGYAPLKTRPILCAGLLTGFGMVYFIFAAAVALWFRRSMKKIGQQETAERRPAPFAVPVFEYRSQWALWGLPLIHIRLRGGIERGPVKAWIAGGDAAIGLVFAFGGLAIAPVSIGGLAAGLLTVGGLAMGLISFGGFSLGLWAIGGIAVGGQAVGGCALAWRVAEGFVAVAREGATGMVALARHANDADAQAFVAKSAFFRTAHVAFRYANWLYLLFLLPLALGLWNKKQRKAPPSSGC